MPVRVTLVILGDAGAGHLVRALAIARGVERTGAPVHLTMVHVAHPWTAVHVPDHIETAEVTIRPQDFRTPALAGQSGLARAIRRSAPDLLVCDLHWAPAQAVLAAGLDVPAWLLLRSHPPVWLTGPPWLPFERERWQRVFAIEPLDLDIPHDRIDPIVIADPDEAQPQGALRRRLGVDANTPLTVLMQAGKPGYIELLAGETVGHVHRADLHDAEALFPICTWLPGADRILCGGGYNSFWEAARMGYADRTTFTALPTQIDDQGWRIETFRGVCPERNGANVLAELFVTG